MYVDVPQEMLHFLPLVFVKKSLNFMRFLISFYDGLLTTKNLFEARI